jgi:hypothetical protein
MTGFAIPGAVEAEDLVSTSQATSGATWAQDMGQWEYGEAWSKRGALFWQPDKAGSDLVVPVPVAAAGKYLVLARMVGGPGFASVQFSSGGRVLGAPVDLYASGMKPMEVPLGTVDLVAGANPLTVSVTGKNALSRGFTVGIDAFILSAAP